MEENLSIVGKQLLSYLVEGEASLKEDKPPLGVATLTVLFLSLSAKATRSFLFAP